MKTSRLLNDHLDVVELEAELQNRHLTLWDSSHHLYWDEDHPQWVSSFEFWRLALVREQCEAAFFGRLNHA